MACVSSAIGEADNTDEEPFQDSGSEYEGENETTGSSSDDDMQKPVKCKKRIRTESTWKRNVAKKKRNAGEEYINRFKRVVPAKTFQETVNCCKNKCWEKITPQRQLTIFRSFYDIESFDLKSAYIFSLVEVVNKLRTYTNTPSRREKTRVYFLLNDVGEKIKVCKDLFKKVLQVSDGRISRVLANKQGGLPAPVDRRGKQPSVNKTPDEKIKEVEDFIGRIPTYQSHYSRRKNPNRKYLAPDLSLGKLYELYKKEKENSDNAASPVSMYIFREVFLKKINLHFHAPISDSCKRCDLFENKIKFATDEEEKRILQSERELHQRKADSARDGMRRDGEIAKSNPEELTTIAFDLMKTLPTPILSTGICYYKRQLWTYCLGIHNLGTNEVFMYTWDESLASRGPQEVGSCVLHYIKNFVKTEKLIMYSDQCGGQNRNIKMAALCNYIVSSNLSVVKEIHHKFLVSGHSYLPCDQDFGLVEKQKKFFKDIFVPDDWNKVIESARKKKPFNVIKMSSCDFYSTVNLEKNLTNRKLSANKSKVEWLKIQWLHFKHSDPFCIFYKYSNNDKALFDSVNIAKRQTVNSETDDQLGILYPNGHKIDTKKKKDLLELVPFIPPVHHNFYENLKTTEKPSEAVFSEEEEEDGE